MEIYTSEQILKLDDLYDIAEKAGNLIDVYYQLTNDEIQWLRFIKNKYSIYDYIIENSFENEQGDLILKIDGMGIGEALKNDGTFPKAVCLSDNTALQKLFFWCAIDIEE